MPLTPAEVQALGRLNVRQADLVPVLQRYGQTQESSYAGTVIEGAEAVLLVVGPVLPHEAALQVLLNGSAGWKVRQVRWSLAELESFAKEVELQRPWLEANAVFVPDAAVDLLGNRIVVDYVAPNEAIGSVLSGRLGDPDWLELRYLGPPSYQGPRGELKVTVTDQEGRPVKGLYCEALPLDPTINADTGEAFNTNAAGVCAQSSLPAAAYDVVINRLDNGEPIPIGKARVTVVANGVTRVAIAVGE